MCIIQRTRFNRACIFFMREAVPHSGFADRLHSTTTVGVSPLCRNWMGKGWRRGGEGRNFFTDHRMVMKIGSDPSDPSIPPRQRPPASQRNWKGKGVREKAKSEGYFQYIPDTIFFQLFFRLIPLDCQKETLLFIFRACDIIHPFKKVFLFLSRKKSI